MIDVPRETRAKLDRLRDLVLAESTRQNLISASTIEAVDSRHIDDSLQLLPYVAGGILVDIGTGAGFPGLVLACCRHDPVHLVEPRGRRAAFLTQAVTALGLEPHTTVWPCRIEHLPLAEVDVITARAVAALPALFAAAEKIAGRQTRWVLPKGRSAESELATARTSWQGEFELVPSVTDPDARIVLASDVHRRRKG